MDKERLEKLDMIRERTGASYGEADAALTKNDGDIVKAIIDLEGKGFESGDEGDSDFSGRLKKEKEEFWVKGNDLVDKVKEIIKKGNVTRIIVKNEEGQTLVEIPVTIGVVGTVIAPYVAILGGLAALVTRCKIVIEKQKPVKDDSEVEQSSDQDNNGDEF
mgnify:CR=1 FL=1